MHEVQQNRTERSTNFPNAWARHGVCVGNVINVGTLTVEPMKIFDSE